MFGKVKNNMSQQLSSFVALVSSENMILTIQRSRLVKHPELWGLPGGRVEPGETVLEGGAREFQEETGIPLDINKHGHLTIRSGYRWHVTFVPWTPSGADASRLNELLNGKMASDEVMAVKWRTLSEIYRMTGLHKSLDVVAMTLPTIRPSLFNLLVTQNEL
jgi:8-oxo-dGTP pyrophosphatase MutT (NUDIX family)